MVSACASVPRAEPLRGVPAPPHLPRTELPSGHRRLIFSWDYRERVFSAHGQGVARIAPPDSVRLDFFLENGAAGGYVLLIADSTFAPAQDDAARYIPTQNMLWAGLGRLTPTAADTTVAVDGDTLRAEIGKSSTWRAAFVGARLARVDHIAGGKLLENVVRPDSSRIVYRHFGARRTLRLTITSQHEDSAYDEAIWRR